MIIYNASVHHASDSLQQDSLADAIGAAWADYQTGDAWPVSITQDGTDLWTNPGMLGAGQSLRAFAARQGITLKEA